jgi:formylglycine-generating enzyme required for sulfatase activity
MIRDDQPMTLNIPGYEIVRPIGQGGMGAVYLARQLSLDRLVAVKILSLLPRTDPVEQIARFRREAELMAQVHHGNVVPVHDSGTADGFPYLVMDYIEGGNLRRLMEPVQPLRPEQVRPLVLPVADALGCLHAHGIVHRDLKPENILLRHGRTPMLTDFGLAALQADTHTLARTDRVMGTLGYVAPEQQYGLAVDERADEYSMAAVIYELLTGQRPLGLVKPPSQLNPGLGPAVDAVLLRALEEDPDDRYPTVQEFGVALDRVLATPLALPPQRIPPRRRLSGRVAMAIATAVMAPALVAAMAAFQVWNGRPRAVAKPIMASPRVPVRVTEGPRVPGFDSAALPRRLINAAGMTLVLIPAGEFLMGSPDTDAAAKDVEKPRHRVRISRPFYLEAHEVTIAEFRAFVAATGYRTEAEASGHGGSVYNAATKRFEQSPELNWRNPGIAHRQGDDEPVVQVSWNDAMAFCHWLSGVDQRSYRLPSEAEWEYACRAGSTTRWCMGDDPAGLDQFAWIRDQAGCTCHPVGGKKPNDFGLHDMHGNVWEWCLDRFGPYSAEPVVDPTGALFGGARILRGGACARADVDRSRSASRLRHHASFRFHKYGFRVCCPLAEQAARP